MNPDNLKEAWQAQTSQTRLTIDADLLLKEVRRNQNVFHRHDLLAGRARSRRESADGAGVVLFGSQALLALDVVSDGAGPAVGCRLHAGGPDAPQAHPPEPGEPLSQRVESSLAQVEHQIWLLRNVLWWYLLPPGLAILAFFGQCAWEARSGGWWVALVIAGMVAVEALIFAGVYWLNQHAVRSELEPRRQELQALLASLKDTSRGWLSCGQVAMRALLNPGARSG